jgi:hypothetical protein
MKIFKSFKLTWWQASLFKLSTISFGVIIGLFFGDFFVSLIPLLLVLVIVPGIYIVYIFLKQK